jgi:hypothetical protein
VLKAREGVAPRMPPEPAGDHRSVSKRQLVLVGLAAALTSLLAYQLAARVVFPWDLYIWSESSFMTNMMKLSDGASVYSSPEDANSMLYSPGLEYLCYALLSPFGKTLDVRFCRGVVVFLGILAAVGVSASATPLLRQLEASDDSARRFRWFCALAAGLVLFKNFTADVCHPDNLRSFQAITTFALAWSAIRRESHPLALLAAFIGGLGMLAKQPGALTWIGVLVVLVALTRAFRTPIKLATIAGAAGIGFAVAAAGVLEPEWGRFNAFELPAAQAVYPSQLANLFKDVLLVPHRALLLLLLIASVRWLWLRGHAPGKTYLITWAVLGATGAAPEFLSYVKAQGAWNSLGILDLWACLVVLPVLWRATETHLVIRRWRTVASWGPHGVAALLCVTALPTRIPPSPAHYAYGRALDEEVSRATREGTHLLLAHGTTPLTHNGKTEIPLDRAVSVLELIGARHGDLAGTPKRIFEGGYDVIIMDAPLNWYGPLAPFILQRYDVVSELPGAPDLPGATGREGLGYHYGYMSLLMQHPVLVLRKKR